MTLGAEKCNVLGIKISTHNDCWIFSAHNDGWIISTHNDCWIISTHNDCQIVFHPHSDRWIQLHDKGCTTECCVWFIKPWSAFSLAWYHTHCQKRWRGYWGKLSSFHIYEVQLNFLLNVGETMPPPPSERRGHLPFYYCDIIFVITVGPPSVDTTGKLISSH